MPLRWTQTNGGPLLLLEERALPSWRGVTNLDDPTDPRTDYGRACSYNEWLQILRVGDFEGLVLGDDPTLPATFATRGEGVLIVQTFAPEEQALDLDALWDAFERESASSDDVLFRVSGGPLHLFDSAFPGVEAHAPPVAGEERLPALTIPCRGGAYRARTVHVALPDGEALTLHRLVPGG